MALAYFIESIENQQVTVADGSPSPNPVPMTKGQNWLNCVPFMSFKCTSDQAIWARTAPYIQMRSLSSGSAQYQRGNIFGTQYVNADIVEFNPAYVRVQTADNVCNQVGMGTDDSNDGVTGGSVNLVRPVDISKAFLMVSYQGAASANGLWDVHLITAEFDSSSKVRFRTGRDAPQTIKVYYYVVEALEKQMWDVQHLSFDMTGTEELVNIPAGQNWPVTASNTMIIANYRSDQALDDTDRSCVSFDFSGGQLRARRGSSTGTMTCTVQLVTSPNFSVQHGEIGFGTDDTNKAAAINTVVEANSFAWGKVQGGISATVGNGAESQGFTKISLDSATEVGGETLAGLAKDGVFQVVEFSGDDPLEHEIIPITSGSETYTIYSDYIDEELSWFPATLSLTTAPTGFWSSLDSISADDDFTGADGDLADENLWSTADAIPEIQDNELRCAVDSGNTRERVNSRGIHTGDFDIWLDYNVIVGPATNGWFGGLSVIVGSNAFYMTRAYRDGSHRYTTWETGNPWSAYTNTSDTSGLLRITRVGSNAYGYYYDAGWQLLRTFAIGAGDATIQVGLDTFTGLPTTTLDFDNFFVDSTDGITWDTYADRVYFTDSDDNKLYAEIETFSHATTAATYHLAVPTILADTDEPITLNWDWGGREYSVRELPAADYRDRFTGDDDSSPDTTKWFNIGAVTTIQSNQLNQLLGAGADNADCRVYFIDVADIVGNFDIQVDYDLITKPNASFWGGQLVITDADGEGCSHVVGWYGRQQYWTWVNNVGWQADIVSHDPGKLRVTRVGNTWTALHWDGSAWQTNTTWTTATATPLTDIRLVLNHGNTDPACEINWDNFIINSKVYDITEVDDDFTGSNGDPPDPLKWDTIIGVSPTIQSNALEFDTSSGVQIVESNYHISGDFDIQTDFDLSSSPATDSWSLGLRVQVDDDNHFSTRIEYDSARNYKKFAENGGAVEGVVTESTSDTSGQLRITRVGDDFAGYYWDAGSWNQIGTDQTVSGMSGGTVSIRMTAETWNTNPTMIGTIDNFQINGADSITGWTDDTGEIPAQQVWDSNFQIVAHLAQDEGIGLDSDDILDSTSNEYHGSSNNMDSSNSGSNEFGKYLTFDGSSEFIDFGDAFYSDILTVESVINPTVVNDYDALLHKRNAVGTVTKVDPPEWEFSIQPTGNIRVVAWQDGSNFVQVDSSTANLVAGVENYVAGAFPGNGNGNAVVHLNDSENGSATQNKTIGNRASGIQAASRTNEIETRWYSGDIREIRISNSFRSEAWRKATHFSLNGEIWSPLTIPDEILIIQSMAVATSTEQFELFLNLIIQNLNVLTSAEATKIIPILNINDLDINTVVGRMKFWEALSTINNSIEFRTLLRTLISRTPKRTIESRTLKRILRQYDG